jgi:hypothetical protein
MSWKAHMLWQTLDTDGMAPQMFSQILLKAWEYFSSLMLVDKLFDFLLLCNDREWKLREWLTRLYLSWHCNQFNIGPDNAQGKSKYHTLDYHMFIQLLYRVIPRIVPGDRISAS